MKKIICFSFSFLMVIVTVINFLNYSGNSTMLVFDNTDDLTVITNDKISNTQLIKLLVKTAKELNTDVAFQTWSDDLSVRKIYKTNNTDDFLNLDIYGESQKLSDKQCISTLSQVKGYTVIPLNISNFQYDTTVYPLTESNYSSVDSTTFKVSSEFVGDFQSVLEKNGIELVSFSLPLQAFLNVYNPFTNSVCPFLVVLFSIFIYFLNNAKRHTLKRLEGYSSYRIMLEEIGTILLRLAIIFAVVEVLNAVLFAIHNINLLPQYLQYTASSILTVYIPAIIFVTLLSSVAVIFHNNNLYIKGKENKTFVLILSAVIKTITTVLMCVMLIDSINALGYSVNKYITAKEAHTRLSGYTSVRMTPVTNSANDKNMQNFYLRSVKEYNAITTASSYYEKIDSQLNEDILYEFNGENDLSYQYNDENDLSYEYDKYVSNKILDVNANYFKINPIYKTNGELVSEKDFAKDKYNLLVAENAEHTDALIKYVKGYLQIGDSDFNVIYYKENQRFLLIDACNTSAYAVDPYVNIAEGIRFKRIKNYYPSEVTGNQNQFLLKLDSTDSYSKVLKLAKETGVEESILDVQSTSAIIATEFEAATDNLLGNAIQTVLYAFLYVFLTVFFIKTYQETYQSQIAVKKLSGGGVFMLHKKYIWASVIMLMLTVLGVVTQMIVQEMLYTTPIIYGIATPIILWVIEMIFFALYASRLTRKNILETLKGVK